MGNVLLPYEATEEMLSAYVIRAWGAHGDNKSGYAGMIKAAPNAGKVSQEMVEAAARASLDARFDTQIWDTAPDYVKEKCRKIARAVIESLELGVEGE